MSHDRRYEPIHVEIFNRLKASTKQQITLVVLATDDAVGSAFAKLDGIDHEIRHFPDGRYLNKVYSGSDSKLPYSIKLDEDIFISPRSWDHFIENLSCLDAKGHSVLTLPLQNGIPTCEIFLDDYLDDAARAPLYQAMADFQFGWFWGIDYTSLRWNRSDFYEQVRRLETPLKGVHPVRFSLELQKAINAAIFAQPAKFLEPNGSHLEEIAAAYFCNSVFAIRTSNWRQVCEVSSDSFPAGGFDEVPLNQFIYRTGGKLHCLRGLFGLHALYRLGQHEWPYEQWLGEQILGLIQTS